MSQETTPETMALEDAAFHAWVTLGDMISREGVTMAEIKNAYEGLEEALKAFRAAHPPQTKPPAP